MLHGLKMNDKIKDLAILSGGKTKNVCYGHGWYEDEFQLKDEDIQKFAELILKTAMDIIREEMTIYADPDCDNAIKIVSERFGIEFKRKSYNGY